MTNAHHSSVWLALLAWAVGAEAAEFARPSASELAELVGQQLPSPIRKVVWRANEPWNSNAAVYAVESPKYEAGRLKLLASMFNMRGEPEQIPLDFAHAPGMWIKEKNATNSLLYRSVAFSFRTGYLVYDSADSGYRWDVAKHIPAVNGVPKPHDARDRALRLLENIGIGKEQLERDEAGAVHWSYTTDGTTYTDRKDGTRKRAVYRCNVMFWQRVPGGGKTLSIGSGGVAQVGFASGGEVSHMQVLLRSLKPVGEAKALTKENIVTALKGGRGWTWRETIGDSVTVTNCSVVYPQGNLSHHQSYVWPFYGLSGYFTEAGETNALTVYVPFKW
jgi:hypothetical protein